MNDKIHKQAKRVYRHTTNGQPTPEEWLPVEAWSDGRRVVIVGTPHDEGDFPEGLGHDCDVMGCSSIGNHIVGKFDLPAPITVPTRGNWLQEKVLANARGDTAQ